MPVIRVDDDVFRELQKRAEPLVDTPNSVLRRLLGLDKGSGVPGPSGVSISGKRTPRSAFRLPILQALEALKGRGRMSRVLEQVETIMRADLKPADRERLPSGGEIRWRNTAAWERYLMVKDGLLRRDSPRGMWEMTDKGREVLRQARNQAPGPTLAALRESRGVLREEDYPQWRTTEDAVAWVEALRREDEERRP